MPSRNDVAFYLVKLRHCSCGKPATHAVEASGNVKYGSGCKPCMEAYLERLKRS